MDDIDAFVWAKLGAAGTMSSISALTRLRIGPNSDSPAGVRLIERMMGEIVAVAQARGIAIDLETVRERAFGNYSNVPNHKRSEERSVGTEWVSTCRSRWSPDE